MFTNYLKTAFRNLLRNKTFSIINIVGLAIGLAASLTIAMWVFDEFSYDRFHINADNIYRVERDIVFQGQEFKVPVTGAIFGHTLLQDYPEVIDMCRIDLSELSIENQDGIRFNDFIHFADTSFFSVFTFPLKKGDPKTALKEPRSLILTPKAARKYFGDEDPMNKVLRIDWEGKMTGFKVSGIFEELPTNKHFQFEMLSPISSNFERYGESTINSWVSNYLYTYILLQDGSDKIILENKLDELVAEKIIPAYKSFLTSEEGEVDASMRLFLRPLTGIHLKSGLMWDIEVQGDISTVYIFSVVSLLILLIACFNFMSLSTAQANTRSLEVGIRKTVGSTRDQLIRQFLGESIITVLIAFVLAMGIIQLILPLFNGLTNKSLSLLAFGEPINFLILILIVVGTGILSGTYPAFFLAAVKPILVLKGRLDTKEGNFSFRQVLVVLQFAISIALIIGTTTAMKQLNYLHNKPLGYDKENILVLPVESKEVVDHFEPFKADLLKNTSILSVSSSSKVPAEREYSDTGWESDKQEELFLSRHFAVNWDFFETYKLQMVAGRAFDKKHATDKNFKVIINETAAKKVGYTNPEDAIGDKWNSGWIRSEVDSLFEGQIIGVVKDFHYQSLKNELQPLSLFLDQDWMNRISIRFKEGQDENAIRYIESTWQNHFPEIQFDYSYVNDYLTKFYKADEKLQAILLIFTILAIVIACLGLFGLAIFIARQRIKEIGVRKALGASTASIVFLLSRSFSKWVIVANVIAWPTAWYFMNEWLSTFQYSTSLSPWIFVLSGLAALLIALTTIAYRSYTAAQSNPVDSLQCE